MESNLERATRLRILFASLDTGISAIGNAAAAIDPWDRTRIDVDRALLHLDALRLALLSRLASWGTTTHDPYDDEPAPALLWDGVDGDRC